MLLLIGVLLSVLGLVSGGALLASSMGLLTVTHALTLWIMFPLGTAVGLLIASLGAHVRIVPLLLKSTGSVTLLLAAAAIGVLVLGATGTIAPPQATAVLWYVFVVGLIMGVANFLALAAPGQPA
jgi:hypothetical protein